MNEKKDVLGEPFSFIQTKSFKKINHIAQFEPAEDEL